MTVREQDVALDCPDMEACAAPPQPAGRVVARTVQIDVSEMLDLDTGYAREGWHDFLWLSGWKARVAVFVLKCLVAHR